MERSTPNADPWERSKMTSINSSTGTSLPYDTVVAGQQVEPDPYAGPYTPAVAGASVDGANAAADYGTAYDSEPVSDDVGVAGGGFSAVAGAQPAIAEAPTATLDDLAGLGLFSDEELAYVASLELSRLHDPRQAGGSPVELGDLYLESVGYMQSPDYAQWLTQQHEQATRPVESTDPVDPADRAEAEDARPGWTREWNERFKDAFDEAGFDSKTRMLFTAQLRSLGLTETELQQAFEYYTGTEEGLAELRAADEQVRAGDGQQAKYLLATGAMTAIGVGTTTALATSRGNLSRVLSRVAVGGADDAARAVATRALDGLNAGTLSRGTALADEAAAVLRAEASATNRLLHPLRKAATNAAARHLTESARLAPKEILKYGLWMKTGDAVSDAAKAATAVAGATDDAARVASVAAGSADDVARAAGQAARGAGMLSKAGKALGPIGLVAGAALGAWGIKQTIDAEGGFGEESAKMTGNVTGGLAGGVAGAAAGAAIGSVVPVIGTGIGAVVGGIVGGFGGGAIGERVGGFLHGVFG